MDEIDLGDASTSAVSHVAVRALSNHVDILHEQHVDDGAMNGNHERDRQEGGTDGDRDVNGGELVDPENNASNAGSSKDHRRKRSHLAMGSHDHPAYRKAPQAPKRFKSSYILFFMEHQSAIKEELGADASVSAISKRSAELWKHLPPEERSHWDDVAARDKQRYLSEKAAYTGPWQVPWKRVKKDPAGAYYSSIVCSLLVEFPQTERSHYSFSIASQLRVAPCQHFCSIPRENDRNYVKIILK